MGLHRGDGREEKDSVTWKPRTRAMLAIAALLAFPAMAGSAAAGGEEVGTLLDLQCSSTPPTLYVYAQSCPLRVEVWAESNYCPGLQRTYSYCLGLYRPPDLRLL